MGHGPWEGRVQHRLFEDELLMVASPDFAGGALPRTPAEVLACAAIRSAEPWAPWCQAAGLPEPPSDGGLWINDSNLSLEAARLGQGVALERRSVADALMRRGELVALTDLRVPYTYLYWVVWPEGDTQAQPEDFMRWLRDEVQVYLAS